MCGLEWVYEHYQLLEHVSFDSLVMFPQGGLIVDAQSTDLEHVEGVVVFQPLVSWRTLVADFHRHLLLAKIFY